MKSQLNTIASYNNIQMETIATLIRKVESGILSDIDIIKELESINRTNQVLNDKLVSVIENI
jgi:hypothetical protein